MISPYKSVLERYVDMRNMVSVHRQGAPTLVGQIKEVDDGGCMILCVRDEKISSPRQLVFVSYEDIRGVGIDHNEPE